MLFPPGDRAATASRKSVSNFDGSRREHVEQGI
jgi:hypothetical protein